MGAQREGPSSSLTEVSGIRHMHYHESHLTYWLTATTPGDMLFHLN